MNSIEQNNKPLYTVVFKESIDLYRESYVTGKSQKETIKGNGMVQEYAGSDFLVLALKRDDDSLKVILMDKSNVTTMVLDEDVKIEEKVNG